MEHKPNGLSQRYVVALRKHLKRGSRASLQPAHALGCRAMALDLETLDLARFHEQALIALVLPGYSPGTRDRMIRRAGTFFAEAITPIENTHRAAREANGQLVQLNQALRQRSLDLIASNRQLQQEILQRKSVEESLRKSEQHYSRLLEQSRLMQEQLRLLSRQLLSAQEEERKMISRELHDEIAQTLTGINVRLASLKTEAALNTRGLEKKISNTQRLVQKSVDIVHRFARELRPTVLDDLGLIPALHSFIKGFTKRTGIHIRFATFASGRIKELNNATRTVFYRVAQEALTNVARHAQASLVEINFEKLPNAIRLKIKDNGKSFQAQRVLHSQRNTRLGLIGMRERLEMVGGSFSVESAPGKGTTVQAQIPLGKARAAGGRISLRAPASTKPCMARPIAKRNFRIGGEALPRCQANRQVCPTCPEISFGKHSMKRITVLPAEDPAAARAGLRTPGEAEAGLELDTPAAKVASDPIDVLFYPRSHKNAFE